MNKLHTIFLATLLAFSFTFVSGCKTLEPGGVYKGDVTLYQAEYAVTTAYTVFDTYLQWEYENRANLQATNPSLAVQTKAAADYVRANAKSWINSAIVTIEAYKKVNSPETRAALDSALAKLQAEVIKAATSIKS